VEVARSRWSSAGACQHDRPPRGKATERGPENPARRIASSTTVPLSKHVHARLPLLCPPLKDPSTVPREACLWGPVVSSGGRCCAVAGIDGPQAGPTQTVHDGPGCGNDSASKDVAGGDPDDVPVGSLSGQAGLDVVVRPDGQPSSWSGQVDGESAGECHAGHEGWGWRCRR
jgi:hypothetical protein